MARAELATDQLAIAKQPVAAPAGPSPAPAGTVTFLFTDIAGSTQLWEQHPAAMPAALARHDGLLREAIERHGGFVFKTIGDAFCAAFAQLARPGDRARPRPCSGVSRGEFGAMP